MNDQEIQGTTSDVTGSGSSVCYVAVECATLGTNFRDIEKDGELWAREVPTELAELFVSDDWQFGNVKADVPKFENMGDGMGVQ